MRKIDIGTSNLKRSDLSTAALPAEGVSVRDAKPAALEGNGSSPDYQNGHALRSPYSERVLSNLYLASYILFTLTKSKDSSCGFSYRFGMRLMLVGKRALDIVISALGLILLAPLFLLFALLVKLDSPGPVFYKQERIGLNRRRSDRRKFDLDSSQESRTGRDRRREDYYGNIFTVYKFRSMVKDAEKKCGPIWATKDDPRITRFGRFLRKTRLDELPQLWNVLMGDMSLVGPRPERLYFVRRFAPQVKNYTRRLSIKPGITGLAQVERGYDSSDGDVNKKLRYDLNYINNWTLGKDIAILFRTMLVMVTGKGAF